MVHFQRIRTALLVCGVTQLIAIFERQVFDFLGFMWLCIAVNFLHVVCVILGIFGALQHRSCYVSLSVVWNLLWIGWNAFIICLHLNVGVLTKDMQILNLGTRTSSWWMTNGPGCVPTYNFSVVDPVTFKPQMLHVENCLLEYQYIEVVHSGLQALLSILAVIFGGILIWLYRGKESTFDEPTKPLPGYSLSLQPSALDSGENYSTAKFLPGNNRSSLYETGPRTMRTQVSQQTNGGTARSGKSHGGGSTRRPSTKTTGPGSGHPQGSQNGSVYRAPPMGTGVDNVRVFSRQQEQQQPLYKTAPMPRQIHGLGEAGQMPGFLAVTSRRPPSPPRHTSNLHPLFIPGSVSPYQSRAGTEISF
ncbi:putative Sodium/potassium-transporting ATPase subunit beta-1-interacting protein [Hypsibius exemplaris]|uniref:Sodium/potassium-transporting ATPase subunit beta-1-interacting protein n=1 Tax=Hypsibius exemplaris TaxID=2072580 RepID=A0A1W0WV84_HYPEX|nr:putative Sodium/potassium-transporting ATPase subunit beta-1-interacting protein [Hypsibius exemplaris]